MILILFLLVVSVIALIYGIGANIEAGLTGKVSSAYTGIASLGLAVIGFCQVGQLILNYFRG